MKKQFLLIALLLLTVGSFAQTKTLNEKDVIKKEHIDFSKEHILFILHGEIEIDGHTILNSKRDKPIEYRANLEKVVLTDGNTEYKVRHCELSGCKVIHLEIVTHTLTSPNQWWGTPNYEWDMIYLNSTTPTLNLGVSSDTTYIKHLLNK